MNDERASLVERLQTHAEELLGQTPTLFAYGIADPVEFPALRDVQLAAYMEPSLPPASYFHVEIRLEALLEEALAVPVAGARVLNGAPLTFQGAVLAAGRVVYNRDEDTRIVFEKRVRRMYLDFRHMLESRQQPTEGAVTIPRDEIAAGLEKLQACIDRLRSLRETASTDPVTEGAARYFLQSAVTCCLGICLDLTAALKLRPPRDFTDIPEVLAEVGLLEADSARALVRLIEVRNTLVHDPIEEGSELTEGLPSHLAGLDRFARAVRERLQP